MPGCPSRPAATSRRWGRRCIRPSSAAVNTQAADKGPSATPTLLLVGAPSTAGSTYQGYASPAAFGRRLASGPFSPPCCRVASGLFLAPCSARILGVVSRRIFFGGLGGLRGRHR